MCLLQTHSEESQDSVQEAALDDSVGELNDGVDVEAFLVELVLGSDSELPEGLEDGRVAGLSLLEQVFRRDRSSLRAKSLLGPGSERVNVLLLDLLLGGRIGILLGGGSLNCSWLKM